MFPSGFKPMLAATLKKAEDADKLVYPVYVSPKIDGIRCVTNSFGSPISRNGKPFANKALIAEFEKHGIPFLDGELGLGDPTSPEFFNATSAFVRTENATIASTKYEKLDYYIFDRIASGGYEERFINNLPTLPEDSWINFKILYQRKVTDDELLVSWESYWHEQNYEGIMIRSNLSAPYKYGRSTFNSGELIKCKRFTDDEAYIVDFIEMMENKNEATKDAWGHTTRSSHKENKVGKGMVGVIVAKANNFPGEIRIGTGIGLTHEVRKKMWENKEKFIGKKFTYSYPSAVTDYEDVRFGSFKGLRYDDI